MSILDAMKKRLERAKRRWLDEQPGILWSYHMTNRARTGKSPFTLIYGTEAVLLGEIGTPTPRTLLFPIMEE